MIRMMEIANCKVTSTFRKEILLPPIFKNPFNTLIGLNEDMKVAGYKPDMIPTAKGTRSIGTMICHFNKILISSCCPDILLREGINNQVRKKAKIIAIHVTRTDSVRNWIM